MGTKERRAREREAKEREMIEGAKQLLFEKGYAGTTMDDIVARLELSKGGLYHHFSSKDEVYYAVAADGLRIMGDLFEDAASSEVNGLEKMIKIGQAYIRFWGEHPNYRRLFQDLPLAVPPSRSGPRGIEFLHLGDRSYQLMVDTIEEGIKDGSIQPNVPARTLALCASASLDGVLNAIERKGSLMADRGQGREEVLSYTLEIFRKSIASKECLPERGPTSEKATTAGPLKSGKVKQKAPRRK